MTRISKRVKRSNKSRSYKLRGGVGSGRFSQADPEAYVKSEELEELKAALAKASLKLTEEAPPPRPPKNSFRSEAAAAEEPPPRPPASLKPESLRSVSLLSASAELPRGIDLFKNDSKYSSKYQIYKNIYELLMAYISKGIKLMLFDFDNTVSKQHLYDLINKQNMQLIDILHTINDEHTLMPEKYKIKGTYFPKIYESFHYPDKLIREGLKFHTGIDALSDVQNSESFFKVFCIIAKQLGLQIGIVSRGNCDVIQQVLNTVFTNSDVRMVCIPDFRIEGGKYRDRANDKCPGGVGLAEGKSPGLAEGKSPFKNIAIMRQINMIGGILPENVIMFDDDNKNLTAIKADDTLKAMHTYHLKGEDSERGIDFKTLQAAVNGIRIHSQA